MKSLIATSFLILAFLLTGCDPVKTLTIKVKNKDNLSVTLYTNNRILPSSHKADSGKLIIRVPYNDTNSKTFHYGIGIWPNESIANLASIIDSIVIINSSGKIVLSSNSNIQAYLKKHRGGYAGSILTIEAK